MKNNNLIIYSQNLPPLGSPCLMCLMCLMSTNEAIAQMDTTRKNTYIGGK
jgi:hypothetical protein